MYMFLFDIFDFLANLSIYLLDKDPEFNHRVDPFANKNLSVYCCYFYTYSLY